MFYKVNAQTEKAVKLQEFFVEVDDLYADAYTVAQEKAALLLMNLNVALNFTVTDPDGKTWPGYIVVKGPDVLQFQGGIQRIL